MKTSIRRHLLRSAFATVWVVGLCAALATLAEEPATASIGLSAAVTDDAGSAEPSGAGSFSEKH